MNLNRKPPKMDALEVSYQESTDEITQTRKYRLITPLYGGGVNPNQSDPITVVRGTEVRGQLRFWWRATQLGRFSSVQELHKSEEELWGSTKSRSEVIVEINDIQPGNSVHAFEVKKIGNKKPGPKPSKQIAPYAAFPLQPEKEFIRDTSWKSDVVILNVKFQLVLRFPKKYQDVMEDCLWAWETFGGLGARTRRGFGAIHLENWADVWGYTESNAEGFWEWLKKNLRDRVVEVKKPIIGVPYLSRDIQDYAHYVSSQKTIACWKNIIFLLQRFRQFDARFQDKFGLSQWPEANAIRDMFGKAPKFPADGRTHKKIIKFPRAKLGLPINFHLPHDHGLPDEIILQGDYDKKDDKWIDRMASPLILRPIVCADGCVGLAAVLLWEPPVGEEAYTPPGGLRLKGAPKNPSVKSDLTATETSEIPTISQPDILKSFLKFFMINGGK